MEVLHNYYDANAERERLAAQAAQIAAQKAAAAKLAAAKLQARGMLSNEVHTMPGDTKHTWINKRNREISKCGCIKLCLSSVPLFMCYRLVDCDYNIKYQNDAI